MKLKFWEKAEIFRDDNLSAKVAPDKSGGKLVLKIVVIAIIVCAIVNAVLLGFVSNKAKVLRQDKEVMAESLNKISMALNKPVKATSADFMDCAMLPDYTAIILKQINDIIEQRNAMIASLQNIAEVSHYQAIALSDTNDINVIQSRLRGLTGYSKKLFELNSKLTDFTFKAANLTAQSSGTSNEFKEKLNAAPENIYIPILDNIERNKKSIESLQQEIEKRANTIDDLKKTIAGDSASKNELQQIIQQKQNELVKVKNEYSSLRSQIENVAEQQSSEKSSATAVTVSVKKTVYPELYYKLKGKVMEYNSKWGFIIIDFGSDSKVAITIEGEEKGVNTTVPLNKEVYIARGDKFVAKAKIVSVYSKYSVANIIFPVAEEVKQGDSVFFDQPKNN